MGTEKQEELLQIKNLAISFYNKSGEVQAVRGISYTLHKGEVLGIVGESGSGKSVSSHGILRLTPDTGKVKSGEILFHGKDILKMSRKELQELRGNKIAMIFQDPMTSLDPLFTVEYQLNESLKKHTSLDAQARKKRMLELLTLVGINQPERRVKQYPYEFSGGMRQRVMIAMALSCDPELLIADEPTTALDVTIQAQIVELLKELKEKLGMAEYAQDLHMDFLHPVYYTVTERYAQEALMRGLEIHAWTVNEGEEAHRLERMGVQAVIGNRPVVR